MKNILENNNNITVTYGRGYAYYLKYHLVWCTKELVPVFEGDVKDECIEIIEELAEQYKFTIESMQVLPSCIKMKISCKPQFFISDMIKIIKGNIARWLFIRHEELKEAVPEGKLWNVSYLAIIDGPDAKKQIEEYLEKQK